MTIADAPDGPPEVAKPPPDAPMRHAAPVDRVEIMRRSVPRRRRRTALTVLSFIGQALLIAVTAILFLIVLAFVIDDPDPVRMPSQSASMRY